VLAPLMRSAFAFLAAFALAAAGPFCSGRAEEAGGERRFERGAREPAVFRLILGARVAPGLGAAATREDPLAFRRGAEALAGLGFRGFFAHHFSPLDGEKTLAALFDHPSYRVVLEHPELELLVFTVRSLGAPIDVRAFDGDPATVEPRLAEEERQILELSRRLLADPALAGKTVVLKFWESDWMLVRPSAVREHAPVEAALGFVEWSRARQAAVERARAERPESPVTLLHAVEVNRVHDALPADGSPGLLRAVHLLPRIEPDHVAYSAWDSINDPPTPAALDARLGAAIDLLLDPARQLALAADICRSGGPCLPPPEPRARPRRLAPSRLFLSEFGFAEAEIGAATARWKAETVVRTAARHGLRAAFAWQLWDTPAARGLALLHPDGTPTATLEGIQAARRAPNRRQDADGGVAGASQ
jgi:hypothetical protein